MNQVKKCSVLSTCTRTRYASFIYAHEAHNIPSTKEKSMSSAPLTVPTEPDLSNVCKNDSDRMNLRNLLYTIWAIHRHGGAGDAVKCYLVKITT